MFGLGFGKLVVLAIIIAIVWFGFRYAERVGEVRRALAREREGRRTRPPSAGAAGPTTEDLVKCERCSAYVAARTTASCGRADCPWGR